MTGIDGRAVLGRQIVRVDDVLHAEGNAVQRTARCGRKRLPSKHLVAIDMLPRLHVPVARIDARQAGLREFD